MRGALSEFTWNVNIGRHQRYEKNQILCLLDALQTCWNMFHKHVEREEDRERESAHKKSKRVEYI